PQPAPRATLRPFVVLATSQRLLIGREGSRAMPRSRNRAVAAATTARLPVQPWPRTTIRWLFGWVFSALIILGSPTRGQGSQRGSGPQRPVAPTVPTTIPGVSRTVSPP